MAKHGKKYLEAAAKVDREQLYSPLQAVSLAKSTSTTSYDATVEVAMRLGVDPRKADQMVRGTVNLDRKSTRLNSSHVEISYAVFCLKKKKKNNKTHKEKR